MSMFTLRVYHPSVDPYRISEELGLPPQTAWMAGGEKRETFWQTRLLGNETGRGDVNSALRDIAARFEHYRFFIDEVRAGGGRVEIAVTGQEPIAADLHAVFADLRIDLVIDAPGT